MMAFKRAADRPPPEKLGDKPVAQTRWQRSVCLAVMRWLAISAPLILAALAGCDLTGQYDKKFHEALGAAAKRAVFDLVHPTFTDALDPAKAGVGVKLRLPIV